MNQKSHYVSCINICGIPILPPLMTPALRNHLLNYKQQAIKLELRLNQCRELKQNLKDLFCIKNRETPCSQIIFDGDISHMDALNISENNKSICLTREIIEISQYDDSGMKTVSTKSTNMEPNKSIRNLENCDILNQRLSPINAEDAMQQRPLIMLPSSITISTASNSPLSTTRTVSPLSQSSSTTSSSVSTPVSHLIRSNSYTLECPSAALLTHMHNLSKSEGTEISSLVRLTIDNDDLKLKTPPTKNKTKINSDIIRQLEIQAEQSRFQRNNEELEKILKSVPEEMKYVNIENMSTVSKSEVCRSFDSSKDIFDTSAAIETLLIDNNDHSNVDRTPPAPSQLLENDYTFLYNNENVKRTLSPSIKLIDLEAEASLGLDDLLNVTRDVTKSDDKDCIKSNINNKDINLLPPEVDEVTRRYLRMDWAAIVIGSHIKGYLTRRLFQTDKIQNIVSTVKDVLICAVELHQSEIIDEKDIELHRRLISQLSAALYSFHEIFFDLSINEQMSIISLDRERKKEKLTKSIVVINKSSKQPKRVMKLNKLFNINANRSSSNDNNNNDHGSIINLTKT